MPQPIISLTYFQTWASCNYSCLTPIIAVLEISSNEEKFDLYYQQEIPLETHTWICPRGVSGGGGEWLWQHQAGNSWWSKPGIVLQHLWHLQAQLHGDSKSYSLASNTYLRYSSASLVSLHCFICVKTRVYKKTLGLLVTPLPSPTTGTCPCFAPHP